MTACTARRRGVPFTRVRRRGLRFTSGRPACALGNPPTLRRSSFPHRVSRPVGGPLAKHAWGAAPRPLSLAALDTNLFLGYRPKTNPYCTQMGLKRACGAFLSPLRWSAERRTTTPVPSSKEGNYGAGKQILSDLQAMVLQAADPWLWLAGLSVCRKREGVPLPRSGGGREGADVSQTPY